MHYYLILIAENNLGFTLRFDFVFFLLAWHRLSKLISAHASFVSSRHGIIQTADFVFLLRTSAIFKQA